MTTDDNNDENEDQQNDPLDLFMRMLLFGADEHATPEDVEALQKQYEQRMLDIYYILDDAGEDPHHPASMDEYFEWCTKVGGITMQIALDVLPGDVRVSTIFMSLDHGFGSGAPVLYETMVFGGLDRGYQRRYRTKKQALAGHKQTIAEISGGSHN